MFRSGLQAALASLDAQFLEAGDIAGGFELLGDHADIDAVLLDLGMPGNDEPWKNVARIRDEHPTVPVIIVSGSEEPETVRQAIDAGAAGFIPKSSAPELIRSALQLVLDGGLYLPPQVLASAPPAAPAPSPQAPKPRGRRDPAAGTLTGRQKEVAELLSKGLTNSEIAGVLKIAEGTVKTHISAILSALDVTNRTEAVLAIREASEDD